MSEFDLQKAIVELLQRFIAPNVVWFAVPNGEKRNHETLGKLKAMGVKKGVADICIVKDGRAHFLELKSAKGRTSTEQEHFLSSASEAGAECAVVRTPEYAGTVLHEWGVLKINPFGVPFQVRSR